MKNAPTHWTLKALIEHAHAGPKTKLGEMWVPARTIGYFSWRQRLRLAWMVFTGRADALTWPEDDRVGVDDDVPDPRGKPSTPALIPGGPTKHDLQRLEAAAKKRARREEKKQLQREADVREQRRAAAREAKAERRARIHVETTPE